MATGKIIIDYWDVGQADASVITLPDGSLILIDTARKNSSLAAWLCTPPLKAIHAIVLTHNDADHVGGLTPIVESYGSRIRTIYLLQDRDIRSHAFKSLFRKVQEGYQRRLFDVYRLERGQCIWADQGLSLDVVYPDFVANISAVTPNETSGIICLSVDSKPVVVWPGDAALTESAARVASKIEVLNGPHHGSPIDISAGSFREALRMLSPNQVFISVGTSNSYSHPKPSYLTQLKNAGCKVQCSQLTVHCDRLRVAAKTHVLNGAAMLGLPSTRNGVSCRGTKRMIIEDGQLLHSRWDDLHFTKVQALDRPLCC